jgi:hypothetical protein
VSRFYVITEKLRKIMFFTGNVVIIPLTLYLALVLLVSIFFNPTDSTTDLSIPLQVGFFYIAFLICFFKFLKKPFSGSKIQLLMIYILTLFILYLLVLVFTFIVD